LSFEAFGSALRGFIEHVEPAGRVHLIGHSMGGAVSAQLAFDAPELVESLILVDAASGGTWRRTAEVEHRLIDRPLWDWAFHLLGEFPIRAFPTATTPVLRDLGHNLIWHFPSMGMAAWMTRRSDLLTELRGLSEHGTRVSVVWGAEDKVVTEACFEDQCTAARCCGTVVPGNHGWLLESPGTFSATISSLLEPALVSL
jgi:pimeloyl-ACP methyl ester carboxylesterase